MSQPAPQKPDAPARIGVYIDGGFWMRLFYYFYEHHPVRRKLAVDGVLDAARLHASRVLDRSVEQVAISVAHYFQGGRNGINPAFAEVLKDLGITAHELPYDASKKRSVGLKGELILTCWAEKAGYDMVMLIAGADDFTPLTNRLVREGARVLVASIDVAYPRLNNSLQRVRTSSFLHEAATDNPTWNDFLAATRNVPGLTDPFQPDEARNLGADGTRDVTATLPPWVALPLASRRNVGQASSESTTGR